MDDAARQPPATSKLLEAQWLAHDGSSHEHLRLRWESSGWTADGIVSGPEVQYAIRFDALWRIRQFLLFRDLEDPDLWLATDTAGRWGEVNGAHRPDLDGCRDLDLVGSPFPVTTALRRLNLEIGHGAEVLVAHIDHESLSVVPRRRRYSRLEENRYRVEALDGSGDTWEFTVDTEGLISDAPGRYQRVG